MTKTAARAYESSADVEMGSNVGALTDQLRGADLAAPAATVTGQEDHRLQKPHIFQLFRLCRLVDEHKTLIQATFDYRIAVLSDRCYKNSLLTAHGFTAIAATHHHRRLSSKKRQYSQAHSSSSKPTFLFVAGHASCIRLSAFHIV